MKTCIYYICVTAWFYLCNWDCDLCEVRAEAEETVGDLNITTEEDKVIPLQARCGPDGG